jgi:hypothetical protein
MREISEQIVKRSRDEKNEMDYSEKDLYNGQNN